MRTSNKILPLATVEFRAHYIETRCSLMLFCKSEIRLATQEPLPQSAQPTASAQTRTPDNLNPGECFAFDRLR